MGNNEEQLRKACVAHKGFRWTEYGAEGEVMASLLSPHKRAVHVCGGVRLQALCACVFICVRPCLWSL